MAAHHPGRSHLRLLRPLLVLMVILLTWIPASSWAASILDHTDPLILNSLHPRIPVYQQGDIQYAYVTLDGSPLFAVAGDVPSASKPGVDEAALQRRVLSIEANMNRTVRRLRSADSLFIDVASLDKQTIILAGNQNQAMRATILTVTELDAQLAQKSIPILAHEWSDIIRNAMQQAWQDRQPDARGRQISQAIGIAVAIVISSLALSALHRWFYHLFKTRKERLLALVQPQDPSTAPHEFEDSVEASEEFKKMAALLARQNLNSFLRRLLRLIQLQVWILGIAGIFITFPETRLWGFTIFAFSMKIFMVVVVMMVLARLCRFLINQWLANWVEEASLPKDNVQRIALRAPTLAAVFSEIVTAAAWILGFILIIDWQQISLGWLLTSAGLIGVALSLVFQNLIRDWLNGFLIIFGDQYAVGDSVTIGNITGLVEGMSLRSTQIRGSRGSLNVIPHGQVTTVQNFTRDWSRADFTVQISRRADVVQAMQVMQEVVQAMAQDPDWKDDILDPISFLGVNQINTLGTQISMGIKTKRARQWNVEREFLKRLKQAFDQQGIHRV
jgi:moderate conductance mechanosensitive channel